MITYDNDECDRDGDDQDTNSDDDDCDVSVKSKQEGCQEIGDYCQRSPLSTDGSSS